jgi:hypothetical protein
MKLAMKLAGRGHMQLVTNLNDQDDCRAALAFLSAHLASSVRDPVPLTPFAELDAEGAAPHQRTQAFVDNVWARIRTGGLRAILTKMRTYTEWNSIGQLASDLGQSPNSVRAALNGALVRAVASAKKDVPGAPELITWQVPSPTEPVFKFKLSPEIKAALAKHIED